MTVTLRRHQVAVEVYSDNDGLNPPENIFMQPVSSDQINMSVIDMVCHCQPQKRCKHVHLHAHLIGCLSYPRFGKTQSKPFFRTLPSTPSSCKAGSACVSIYLLTFTHLRALWIIWVCFLGTRKEILSP